MKTLLSIFGIVFGLFIFGSAHAAGGNPCANKKLGPACQQICGACQGAGFIVGEAKEGDGFWVDCVRPIMSGSNQPQKAVKAGHPLPLPPPGGWTAVVNQCQSTNPGWGTKQQK